MTIDEAQRDLRDTRAAGDTAQILWLIDDQGECCTVARTVNGRRYHAQAIKDVGDALSVVNGDVFQARLARNFAR